MMLLKSSVVFLIIPITLNLNFNYFMATKITRSTVNEQQYSAPEFPKSGFPLSYRRYSSYILGRLHVAGFHWTMPGDKISGRTSGECTFKRIVTPLVSPVNAMQYNIFLPLRPLDRSFKKGITPTKINAMSANWTMPLFNTRYLVSELMKAYTGGIPFASGVTIDQVITSMVNDVVLSQDQITLGTWLTNHQDLFAGSSITLQAFLYGNAPDEGLVSAAIYSLTNANGNLRTQAKALFLEDALLDIAAKITAVLGTAENPLSTSILLSEFLQLYLESLLTPFVGRYSYYAEFKYEYLRPFDFYRIAHGLANVGDSWSWISDTPQNEYAIRAMYAIWYELFRNVDLEPVGGNLPDWQEWSSTSIFDMSAGGNLCYLLYRIRPWENDMFISAQIDDLSRHVYAPIMANAGSGVAYHDSASNNLDTQSPEVGFPEDDPDYSAGFRKPSIYRLGYTNQIDGQTFVIDCPVPSNINDVLSAIDNSFKDVYGLDLNTLRQSQMLEKYLKRNYLFGDEYQDRMLAHYNSRVSDMRINKPEILSRSIDSYNMGQEVSNVSTDETKVGDRTATAKINVNGEEFTTFCEEFGIMVSVVCFMPRAMYDGTCPQNYLSKQVHLPLPEFATNNEEFGRKSEIAGSGLAPISGIADSDNRYMFGRYPAYHAWRSRVDEVGGEFLDELQDSTFRRFFGMFSDDTTPKLNYFFIHCRPNLNMFADPIAYNTQLYGDLVNECFVERVLPTPVEVI